MIKKLLIKLIFESYIENSKNIIDKYTHYKSGNIYYPKKEWADWFLSQHRPTKEYIAFNIKNNPDLRMAFLSNWYDIFKNETKSDISYEDFLETPIRIYRGETEKDIKYGKAYGFDSYTIDISLAKRFANNREVIELNIKPKDTYGLIDTVGNEREVLVPSKFSDEFIEKKFNTFINNYTIIIEKINNQEYEKLEEIINNKKYEEGIEYLFFLLDKYNIKHEKFKI